MMRQVSFLSVEFRAQYQGNVAHQTHRCETSASCSHEMNIFTWINIVYSNHQEFILLVVRSSIPPLTSPLDGLGDTDTCTALTRTLQRRLSMHNAKHISSPDHELYLNSWTIKILSDPNILCFMWMLESAHGQSTHFHRLKFYQFLWDKALIK